MSINDYASNTINTDVTKFSMALSSADTDVQKALETLDQNKKFGDIAGGNYAEFESDGTLKLNGNATAWEDLRVEPTVKVSGSNDPTFTKWLDDGAGSRGIYLYNFDNVVLASQKEIFFSVQMPHAWKGTAISPHVHWIHSTNQNTAAVRWGLEYSWASIGSVFGNSTIIYTATNLQGDTNLVQHKHYISEFADLTPGAGQGGISDILICRLFRNSADAADTSTGVAGLLYIDFHYEIDTLGSRSEFSK